MRNDDIQINDYYSYKDDSYRRKYNNGVITHIHTGLYDHSSLPLLFKEKNDIENLALEEVQYLLFKGQENLSLKMADEFRDDSFDVLLDCGCGYCGTSIVIARNTNIKHIHAITLSERQLNISNNILTKSNSSNIISLELNNILNFEYKNRFDGIFSIETICHVEDQVKLFSKFNSLLNTGGKLVISDYFLYKNHDVKSIIDEYWKTNIFDIENAVASAKNNGFLIEKIINLTKMQMPFWELSQCYSKIMLAKTNEDSEQDRLKKSINFHEFLKDSFVNKKLQYCWIVLSKI